MINSRVLFNGFYLSPENHWIDWHAGNKFEGINYDIYLFLNHNDVVSMSVDSLDFSFDIFNSRMNYIDTYKVLDKNTIEITFNPNDEYPVRKNFTILSSNILLDKDLREYHFKYTIGIEFEEIELMLAINRGDDIWAASNPLELNLLFKDLSLIPVNSLKTPETLANYLINLSDPAVLKQITGFGKEAQTLSKSGYIYNTSTKMFIK